MTYKKPRIRINRPKLRKVLLGWEVILAIIIFLFLLYRVALAYDWIPEEYLPSTIISREYTELKKALRIKSNDPGVGAKFSRMSIGIMEDVEDYVERVRANAARRAEIAAKCNENQIFRFFMEWGGKKTDECLESNVRMQAAEKESGIRKEQPAEN